MSGADVIRSGPHSDNGIRVSKFVCILLDCGVQYEWPVDWRGMNQIGSDTDYYYCFIIKLSCPPVYMLFYMLQ